MRAKMLSALLTATAVGILASLTLTGWWLFGPVDQTFQSTNNGDHTVAKLPGNTIVVYREFKVKRDLEFTLSRELVRRNGRVLARYDLNPTHSKYSKGEHKTLRYIELPELLPGTYELHSMVTWQANPLRQQSEAFPVLTFEIKGSEK